MDLKQHLLRQMAFSHATYGHGERRDPEQVAEIACNMILGKQSRNEARDWPDWRTVDKDKAIEHI